jgi:hypothetical protein
VINITKCVGSDAKPGDVSLYVALAKIVDLPSSGRNEHKGCTDGKEHEIVDGNSRDKQVTKRKPPSHL